MAVTIRERSRNSLTHLQHEEHETTSHTINQSVKFSPSSFHLRFMQIGVTVTTSASYCDRYCMYQRKIHLICHVSGPRHDQQIHDWINNNYTASHLFFLSLRFYPSPKDTVKVCFRAGGQIFPWMRGEKLLIWYNMTYIIHTYIIHTYIIWL